MKQGFWLKLSVIFLAVVLFFSFSLSWFFSVYQSRRLNHQHQIYLSENFSLLYNHIRLYLQKNPAPSVSRLQKIIALYSEKKIVERTKVSKKKFDKYSLEHLKNPVRKSLFLISDTGLVLAHSEPSYKGKKLPESSPALYLIQKYPKGWGPLFEPGDFGDLITLARPVTISSVKYFVVVSRPAQKPGALFLSYFNWILLFSVLCFAFLFLFIFLYLRSFAQAAHFLFSLFGERYKAEQKKALSYLAHTNNFYLQTIRSVLISVLRGDRRDQKKEQTLPAQESSFSNIVNQSVCRSHLIYPHLRIHKELISDIDLPVFADVLSQALWELIKNVAQAFPEGETGELKIRTFKKHNTWFCCEVEDEGPGMNRTTMEKASQVYFTTKKYSSGLGLPFVQSFLSRIGGIMKLQSSENGGLNVCLFIPLDYIAHIQHIKTFSRKKETDYQFAGM